MARVSKAQTSSVFQSAPKYLMTIGRRREPRRRITFRSNCSMTYDKLCRTEIGETKNSDILLIFKMPSESGLKRKKIQKQLMMKMNRIANRK